MVKFRKVSDEMRRISLEVVEANDGYEAEGKANIMSDLTLAAPKEYRTSFGSEEFTKLGITLYLATANIKLNMWKCKDFVSFYYKFPASALCVPM